jgi:hypothetical protein
MVRLNMADNLKEAISLVEAARMCFFFDFSLSLHKTMYTLEKLHAMFFFW